MSWQPMNQTSISSSQMNGRSTPPIQHTLDSSMGRHSRDPQGLLCRDCMLMRLAALMKRSEPGSIADRRILNFLLICLTDRRILNCPLIGLTHFIRDMLNPALPRERGTLQTNVTTQDSLTRVLPRERGALPTDVTTQELLRFLPQDRGALQSNVATQELPQRAPPREHQVQMKPLQSLKKPMPSQKRQWFNRNRSQGLQLPHTSLLSALPSNLTRRFYTSFSPMTERCVTSNRLKMSRRLYVKTTLLSTTSFFPQASEI
eukprot:Protomagalhaensia_sp_Gyna_25__6069@NODE_969_length_2342_cov_4_285714_g770_i0_p2_GENE_NODE_969_length_2342_cov_4_285714_g770_i0NODE_969_length_2342_cov_4_285714_g770_i0_p2_ORF_typecomplete_len260_score16_46_NODE_969_length_2342_cov_4_285714_g770_i04991278